MAGDMSADALWYFGRGTGVSALTLFTLVVVLGLLVRSGWSSPALPRFVVSAVHRTTSLTALGLLAVHVVTLLLDPYAQLRLVDLVVPFLGAYRPFWQGLGTLALDLVVLLVLSSLLRDRLGRRTWRALHWAAYLCWPAALAHAVGNGTDGTSTWMLALVGGCVAAVGGALTLRLRAARTSETETQSVPAPVPPAYLAGLR
ncbi:MAG TPA: ferric reductase-like transmembrane domain-containing protein [Actinomycetales bacterium]|nr:ferric reductase-like transmembrane domain-containing protein [Actinomycetales bacterium]